MAASDSDLNPHAAYRDVKSKTTTGSKGSGPEQFADWGYVTFAADRYIVCDRGNHRIKVYNKDMTLMFIVGENGKQAHHFSYPGDICTGAGNELFISDWGNSRIKVYDVHLQFVRVFGSRGTDHNQFSGPRGLAFTPAGELVVCDSFNYRLKFHRSDGTYLRSLGCRGQGPGYFENHPWSVASTSDGNLIVGEWRTPNLKMFRASGEYMRTIIPSVPNSVEFIRIRAITVDKDDNIIMADGNNGRLIVIYGRGNFVCTIGSPGDKLGELNDPVNVTINKREIVLFELGNKRIQIFKL